MLAQAVSVSDAVDPDDAGETARAPGRDAGERVLEHRRLLGSDAERPGGGEERVRGRFSLQVLALRHDAVDAHVEERLDPGGGQDVAAVGARRDYGEPQRGVARGLEVAHGALVGLHSLLPDQLEDELVLAVPEPGDRLRVRWVVGVSLRELDPPRGEEGANAVRSRLAVDVLAVVRGAVERRLRLAGPGTPLAQVSVEHLLPRRRVHDRSPGQNAVEVEQARPHAVGKAQHDLRA